MRAASRDAAARGPKPGAGALLVGGLLLTGAFGLPMGTLWLRSFPASRVKTCEITYSHRNTLIIALESSETVFLTSRNVPDVRVCIPSGSLIEKRRGEFGYHIAGRYQPPTWEDWIPPFILLGIGLALLVVRALLFLRRSDRSSPLRDDAPPNQGS